MTGRYAAPLPEMFQFIQRQVVAGQMQQGIEQRGPCPPERMKRSRPGHDGITRIVAQVTSPDGVCHRGAPIGKPGVTGIGLLDSVRG